jgi:MFS family permease
VRRLLGLRDARLFLAGQSLSLLGDTALWLALGLWAKDLTGSSSAAGLVFLCIVAPQLASPLAGLLVDRVRRRSLLLAVNPITALAVLPLLAVHGAGDVWIIYAVALAYGASYVLLGAGQSALLHTLVPHDLLGTANAALQTVREGLRLITPLAGAGLYTLAGGAAVAVLDAATFLAATAALLALEVRESKPAPDPEPRAIAAGARHITSTTDLRAMVLGCALCMLVIGFSETLIFELPDALGKPASFVGVLMAVQGVGAIAGALTATQALTRHGELRTAGFGMTIFALGALLMADSALGVVLAGKVLFGLGLPWIVVALLTLLQRSTPPHLQGRAFAASELALGAPQTLSIALGAALVAVVDYRFVLVVQAATVGLAGVYLLTRMHGSWRPWTGTSTTSSSLPTGSPERTPARWWRRWRRSVPRP